MIENHKLDQSLIRYTAAWWREYRKLNAEKLRAYKRDYDSRRYKTHFESEISRRKAWNLRNPEKVRAEQIARNAIETGKLLKKPCVICGETKVNAHHEDYSRPLDVVWLCPVHHSERHSLLRKLKNPDSVLSCLCSGIGLAIISLFLGLAVLS
jgi:hypothetical protein